MVKQTTIAISEDTLRLIQARRSRLKAGSPGLGVRKDLSNGRIVHDLIVASESSEVVL